MTQKTVTIGGRTIDLLSVLGQGTYGSVYLIDVDGTKKAIKIITNVGKEGIKSLREIDIMSRLVHPNLERAEGIIVGIDTGPPTPVPSPLPGMPLMPPSPPPDAIITVGIIMPLAKTDLQRLLNLPTFTIQQRLKILFDVLSGVKYMHDTGHLHLDLKPMNVLIFGEGDNMIGKLTDFGLSLILENNIGKFYPLELVTITHRAPEILKGDRTYTKSSDIWSLGIIFLEVLSGGKTIFTDFTKSKVKTAINKYLNPKVIDNTLNTYLVGLPEPIQSESAKILKRMLSFNPTERPTVDEIMKSPIFYALKRDIGHGMSIYKRPYPPRKCDLIYYYGFDFMVRLALKLSITIETFFLTADIYQRILAFGHHLTGDFKKDWPNVALIAVTSLYMAIKMIEPYFPDPIALTKLASNVFDSNAIIKVEASLTQLFEGIIYPRNLFTEGEGKNRLIYAFDNLLMNCHVYYKIDLGMWIRDGIKKPESPYNKYGQFSDFVKLTQYYQSIQKEAQNTYVPRLYQKDLEIAKNI